MFSDWIPYNTLLAGLGGRQLECGTNVPWLTVVHTSSEREMRKFAENPAFLRSAALITGLALAVVSILFSIFFSCCMINEF